MDILKSALVTLFKEQNPYKILKSHFNVLECKKNSFKNINKKTFVDLYMQLERQYSEDEVQNLYDIVVENTSKRIDDLEFEESVFNILINYSENILENQGDDVKCKYKDLLKWRVTTLQLEPDMFISSYLAYQDILIGKARRHYDWDTIIKSNNKRLNNMLSKGLAENHFHLKGSAPTFILSWVALMNDISLRNTPEIKIDANENRLSKDLTSKIDLKSSIAVAAVIRGILFKLLFPEIVDNNSKDILEDILKKIVKNDDVDVNDIIAYYSLDIQNEINALRYSIGDKIQYNTSSISTDYATTKNVDTQNYSTSLFVGERAFMYKCFQEIYRGNKTILKYGNLFYAYLIIKNKVRAELVQLNGAVGFTNFANYQDRKTKYLKKDTVFYKFVEPGAVLTSIKSQNIKSIELRVIPQFTAKENISEIMRMDKCILNNIYNDRNNRWINELNINYKIGDRLTSSKADLYLSDEDKKSIDKIRNKFFYVYHFPKGQDILETCNKDDIIFMSKCRHYYTRQDIKKYAFSIYRMREKNQEYASRVLGIDTCAYEIKARPEVYGQVFRFLKGHIPSNNSIKEYKFDEILPRLRATYHVGEDFLDCIDGLRAIDEAIYFCNLTHGDRLGHAIVLGIDIKEWYKNKSGRVHLAKQDILDNVAWIITKLKNFCVDGSSETIDRLMKIYNKYYAEIYISSEDSLNDWQYTGNSIVPVDTYMEAWKLRGDAPEIYEKSESRVLGITYWDRCAKKDRSKKNISKTVLELYRRYHYDPIAKYIGYKKEVFKVESYIVDAAIKVQKKMQDYVRVNGIGIECNPSSNVLISTFGRYDKHPILNMYNLGLTIDEDDADRHPQLFVSINTDDQGLFDTLLENEFALMALALEKAKDCKGKPLYNQSMIYDWLDRIREMGLEQSFNKS